MADKQRKKLFGYGLIKPLRRIAGKDFISAGEDANIVAAIKQLVGTRQGELPWAPDFGLNLDKYRHRASTLGSAELAADDIVDGIQEWIPSVSEAFAEVSIDEGVMKIQVRWRAMARNTAASNVILGPSVVNVER